VPNLNCAKVATVSGSVSYSYNTGADSDFNNFGSFGPVLSSGIGFSSLGLLPRDYGGNWIDGASAQSLSYNSGVPGNNVVSGLLDISSETVYGILTSFQQDAGAVNPFTVIHLVGAAEAAFVETIDTTTDFPSAPTYGATAWTNHSRNALPELAYWFAANTDGLTWDFFIMEVTAAAINVFGLAQFPTMGEMFEYYTGSTRLLNDGAIYYMHAADSSGMRVLYATPTAYGAAFDSVDNKLVFDDPEIEAVTSWQFCGVLNDKTFLVCADGSLDTVIEVSRDGTEFTRYDIDASAIGSFINMGGFMFDGATFYGVAEDGGTVNALTFVETPSGIAESNYQLGDVIDLGCWSPCPNVGIYQE
jgi:hypothetical protein